MPRLLGRRGHGSPLEASALRPVGASRRHAELTINLCPEARALIFSLAARPATPGYGPWLAVKIQAWRGSRQGWPLQARGLQKERGWAGVNSGSQQA